MNDYEGYNLPSYNKIIDEILEYIQAIKDKKDQNLFDEVKTNYPYFFENVENVENLENIKIRADYEKKHKMISGSIEYNLVNYLEKPKENYDLLLSLQYFLSVKKPKGGKKSRKRKTAKKSKKSRKRKTAKKRKKSRK